MGIPKALYQTASYVFRFLTHFVIVACFSLLGSSYLAAASLIMTSKELLCAPLVGASKPVDIRRSRSSSYSGGRLLLSFNYPDF